MTVHQRLCLTGPLPEPPSIFEACLQEHPDGGAQQAPAARHQRGSCQQAPKRGPGNSHPACLLSPVGPPACGASQGTLKLFCCCSSVTCPLIKSCDMILAAGKHLLPLSLSHPLPQSSSIYPPTRRCPSITRSQSIGNQRQGWGNGESCGPSHSCPIPIGTRPSMSHIPLSTSCMLRSRPVSSLRLLQDLPPILSRCVLAVPICGLRGRDRCM